MSLLSQPRPVFDHLVHLSDARGLMEHALYAEPRPEHGYCVDDVARGLVIMCREPEPPGEAARLCGTYLDFVLASLAPDGQCHNRMAVDGEWSDDPSLGDWWGRALWGLGVAAATAPTPGMRARALAGFRIAAQRRSPHLHAMVFAGLGAGQLLLSRPLELAARELLGDAVRAVPMTEPGSSWPWPTERLTYANAAFAETLMLAGDTTDDTTAVARGISLLEFLLALETRDGHLSVTPVGGRGLEDLSSGGARAGFDQQPIEVGALADACATAYRITGETRWLEGIRLAWGWFLGDNDASTPMFDPATGGGFDGLEPDGCNLNQGAESTLAMLGTAQQARHHSGVL